MRVLRGGQVQRNGGKRMHSLRRDERIRQRQRRTKCMFVLRRRDVRKRNQQGVFYMRGWIAQSRINRYMRSLPCRKSFIGRLHELPVMQSGDVLKWEDLHSLRRRKVRRVRRGGLCGMQGQLLRSWFELLYFLRRWKKHERREDGLRHVHCR